MTSPPRPPSPPLGPPHGSYFSRRKLIQPRPPSPAVSFTVHSSTNIRPTMQKAQRLPRERKEGRPVWWRASLPASGTAGRDACHHVLQRNLNPAPQIRRHVE